MQSLRPVGSGLGFGLVFVAIVLSGFALSIAESRVSTVPPPTETAIQVTLPPSLPTEPPSPTSEPTLAPTVVPILPVETSTPPSIPLTDTPLPSPTITYTPPPPPTACPPPAGWVATFIQPNDTLPALAQTYRTSIEGIRNANCLFSDQLVAGSFLYLPPLPTATVMPCGSPVNWVIYRVIQGDTLYSLSQRYFVSIADLQQANCLGKSTYLQAGKSIKVPPVVATAFPSSTKTLIPTTTPIILDTPTLIPTTVVPPTEIPSSTPPPTVEPATPTSTTNPGP